MLLIVKVLKELVAPTNFLSFLCDDFALVMLEGLTYLTRFICKA